MGEWLQPSGVLERSWLLPEVWQVVAQYLAHSSMFALQHSGLAPRHHVPPNLPPSAAELKRIHLFESFKPNSLACTPSGVLLVTKRDGSLYAVDPASGKCEFVVRWRPPPKGRLFASDRCSIEVVALESCAYVTDMDCVRRLTLPPQWFTPSAT